MKEIVGDFWEHAPNYDVILVTTNGIVKSNGELVMGAGLAKQFKDRYPDLPRDLGHRINFLGKNIPYLFYDQSPAIISFPTKHHYAHPSDTGLILESAKRVKILMDSLATRYKSVLSVRPGCGLGKLQWEQVRRILQNQGWDHRFTIITPR